MGIDEIVPKKFTFVNGKLTSLVDKEMLKREIELCQETGEYAKWFYNKEEPIGMTTKMCTLYQIGDTVVCPYARGLFRVANPMENGLGYKEIFMLRCNK